jgi:hypothetical protein
MAFGTDHLSEDWRAMDGRSREPIRESGWYRIGKHGRERVPDDEAELEEMTGGGQDLVHVQIDHTEVPLW